MKNLKVRPLSAPGFVKRTTQQSVVNELGAQILRGDFAVGANLPNEGDLTARFGVSRTVIREVMKTLAAKGLVIAKTKVGTRVADSVNWNLFDRDVLTWRLQAGVDATLLTALYELRIAMEPMAAALAAEFRTDNDVKELRTLVDHMAHGGHTSASFVRADLALHLAIGRVSRNPFMSSIGPIIEAAINEAQLKVPSPAHDVARREAVYKNHKAIVDAIEIGDARAARRAMVDVVDDGVQDRGGSTRAVPT